MRVIKFDELFKTLETKTPEFLALIKQKPKLPSEKLYSEIASKLIVEVLKRIDRDVSAAIEQLRQEQSFSFEGQYELGKQYKRGQLVSHDGCLWYCNCQTDSVPYLEQVDWKLVINPNKVST